MKPSIETTCKFHKGCGYPCQISARLTKDQYEFIKTLSYENFGTNLRYVIQQCMNSARCDSE